jgi:hypothetical protein
VISESFTVSAILIDKTLDRNRASVEQSEGTFYTLPIQLCVLK